MKTFGKLFFVITLFGFIFSSCSKSNVVTVNNSIEANEKLDGSWKRQVRGSMDLYSEPENPDSLCGQVTVLATYILTFYTDLSYSMECSQKYESFVQTADEIPYSTEDFEKNFTDSFTVKGTYAADANTLQLDNKLVMLSDGSEMSVAEYYKINPSVGSGLITSGWKVEDNKLTVIALDADNVSVEYFKVKK